MSSLLGAEITIRFRLTNLIDRLDLDRIGGMEYFEDVVTALIEEEGLDIADDFKIVRIKCLNGRRDDVPKDG